MHVEPPYQCKYFQKANHLTLREFLSTDALGMYELYADPEGYTYLGNKPVKSIEKSRQIIEFIREQYVSNGIGRWAVIEK